VTNPQFRLVFAVSKALGYDNDVLHALVRDWTGKTSLRQLRDDEARRLINRLKALANQTPDQAYNSPAICVSADGKLTEYCSPAQAYMLRYLCRQLGVNLARLWAIIESRFGLTQAENTLDDLTHHDAHVLILQFKGELALAKAKQEAAARQGALGV
jgi:hypothetical protein